MTACMSAESLLLGLGESPSAYMSMAVIIEGNNTLLFIFLAERLPGLNGGLYV